MKQRTILAFVTLASVAALAFGIGYVSYPLLHPVNDVTPLSDLTSSEAANPDNEPLDMSIYWQARQLLNRDFYGDAPDDQTQVYAAVRGLVESYNDPYTYFVEPQPRELERDQLRGSFGGIGAYIEVSDAGFVLRPMPDQPAAVAGIQEGDLLLMVDGTPITATMSSDEVIGLVRGPVDTTVTLVVSRAIGQGDATSAAGGNGAEDNAESSRATGAAREELTFEVTRANIETPSLTWAIQQDSDGEPVGVMALSIFSERSADEMRAAVAELTAEGARRFVLDLRGNPGGLVSAALEIADMWLDEGDILIEERADGTRLNFAAEAGQITDNAPLVVVVDGASASASEIVAGAFQDRGRAQLVGGKTFGKGSVQLIHELTDASSLHVTNAQWFTPDGAKISGVGLTPDRVTAEGEDPIAGAIDLLRTSEIARK